MKCIRCNKFMFESVKLADGRICMKCFQELGFDKCMKNSFDDVPFEQIKDGSAAYFDYCRDRDSVFEDVEDEDEEEDEASFRIANYGQEREPNENYAETEIFDILKDATKADDLRLVRKSSNYVTAAIGPTDVARFKFTKRAKWILLPYLDNEKHKIEEPTDVYALAYDLIKAVDKAREINK